MYRNSRKGKRYKKQGFKGKDSTRIVASISILTLIFVLCLWAPLALANDMETTASSPADTAIMGAAPAAVDSPDGTASQSDDSATADAATGVDTEPAAVAMTAESVVGAEADAVTNGDPETAADTESAPAAAASSSDGVTVLAASAEDSCDAAGGAQYGDGCIPEYKLDLICSWGDNGTYWESVDDYQAGLLSIVYHLENNGTGTAYNLSLTSATADNGVTLATDLGSIILGDLGPGDAIDFILNWLVPQNVQHFVTSIDICADCQEPVCEGDDCPPDPCEIDPSSCEPVDPCLENPELCQPVDPCIENPTLCNPVDPGNLGPNPEMAAELAPVLTRSSLPSTGYNSWNGIIIALALLFAGFLVPMVLRARGSQK
ncbi:MAG: hypothetical protein ACWGO1_14205 [Anaerolineales bacterium]